MKRYIIYSIFLFSVGLLPSCEDFLDTKSESSFTEDVIYSNSVFTEGEIMGIYNVIGANNSYRNRLWLQMGINTDIEYRSGWDASKSQPITLDKADNPIALYAVWSEMGEGFNNSNDENPWSRLYQAIERANLSIKGIRQYGNPQPGTDMGHLLGEALTLRAFFYYDLIKWWGDVPARFEPLTTENLYVGKADRDIIYDQIIADLGEAVDLMYSSGTKYTNTTKRLSKDAARGLRARIALSAAGYSMRPVGKTDSEIKITVSNERRKELYEIAREECRNIIKDGKYKLDSSFKNIFYEQCQDVESQGREAIFQLPYKLESRGRLLRYMGLPRESEGDVNSATFNSTEITAQFKVMPNFFYDYDAKDTRRDVTVVPYKVVKNGTLGVMEESLSSGVTGFNIAKWRAEWSKAKVTGTDDGISPIILRYSDVLLMFAEADLSLGGSEGQQYFDQVRERAFGSSDHNLPLSLDNIKKERAFEFCGENIRKYDLIRWGELKSGIDTAKENLKGLRNQSGNYANVPTTIYYRYHVAKDKSPGERELEIYGLNRGEFDDKTTTDPTGGWTKKTWTTALSGTTSERYLSDGFIDNLYFGNPDKRQLLPIMHQIILTSGGMLSNDYGYAN